MEQVTRNQLSVATSGVFIFAHSIEKFLRVVKQYYVEDYKKKPKFKDLVDKLYAQNMMKGITPGLALQLATQEATRTVEEATERAVMKDYTVPYGEYLDQIDKLIEMTEQFTSHGMQFNSFEGENKAVQAFDYIIKDADIMCRFFCRLSNIDDKDNLAEEAIVRYESKGLVDDKFMNDWFRTKV